MKTQVLSLGDAYGFSAAKTYRTPMHRHGCAVLSVHKFWRIRGEGFNEMALLSGLIQDSSYQRYFLAHMTQEMKGVRGPFSVEYVRPTHFKLLPSQIAFKNELGGLLYSDRWQTPHAREPQCGNFLAAMCELAQKVTHLWRLDSCADFNSGQDASQYQHEWSHAVMEFHEYCMVDASSNSLYLLNLIYE